MNRGKFGNAWDAFPIKEGEIWIAEKNGIEHRFLCGDLIKVNENNIIDRLLEGEKVDFVYTDAPWSPGNMKMFYTLSGKDMEYTYKELIESLCLSIRSSCPNGIVFLEMGKKYHEMMINILEGYGAITRGLRNAYYGYPKRQNKIWYGTFNTNTKIQFNMPDNLYGMEVIRWICSKLKEGDNFIDYCCGKGVFLIEGIKIIKDIKTYGVELIPRKLAVLLMTLSRMNYNIKKE